MIIPPRPNPSPTAPGPAVGAMLSLSVTPGVIVTGDVSTWVDVKSDSLMVLVSVVMVVNGGETVSVTDSVSVPEDMVTVSEPEGVGTVTDSVTDSVGRMSESDGMDGSGTSVGMRSVGSGTSVGPGRSGT